MNKKEFIANRPFDDRDATDMQNWAEEGIIGYVKSLSTDGVISGLDVIIGTGMTVKVNPGIGLDISYKLIQVLTQQTANISTAHASLARRDLITIKYKTNTVDNVDTVNKYNRGTSFVYSKNILDTYEVKVYNGTPSASPTAPTPLSGEIILAEVLVNANATTPTSITDRRIGTKMVNSIAPIVSTSQPSQNLFEGLIWYNPSTGAQKLYVNGAFRDDNIHNHTISQITGLQTALDGKSGTSHTHADATTSVSGFLSGADKTKLNGIATNANNYVLPIAGASLGGVKTGGDITIAGDGTITVNDNSHNHTIANITNLQTTLDAKASLNHTHPISDITALQSTLDNKSDILHTHSWADIQSKPSTFAPSTHTHTVSQITDIASNYLRLTGGTLTGSITAVNGTFNGQVKADTYVSTEDISFTAKKAGIPDQYMKMEASVGGVIFRSNYTRAVFLSAEARLRVERYEGGPATLEVANIFQTSDANKKKNIENYSKSALEEIISTPIRHYNFKDEIDGLDPKHVGIVMQEAPIDTVDIRGGGVDTYAMIAMAWKAIQELNEKISN